MDIRVGKLYPVLRWVGVGLIAAVLVGWPSNYLYDWSSSGKAPGLSVPSVIEDSWPWLLVVVSLIGLLTIWSSRDHAKLEKFSALGTFKPSKSLVPSDLGFETVKAGQPLSISARPYTTTYISRRLASVDHHGGDHGTIYTEDDVVETLTAGHSVVVIGQPTEGKTRLLYEVIRRLDGFDVLIPQRDKPVPDHDVFDVLRGRRVVLLLDDLTGYVGSSVDLMELDRRLQITSLVVVAATCRDGPELETVRETHTYGLKDFYERISLKLAPQPLQVSEKEELAESVCATWERASESHYPTPGSIVMADALSAMRGRFERLAVGPRSVALSISLLAHAGVLPVTKARVHTIVETVYKRSIDLDECLRTLCASRFICEPYHQDPIFPEPAYFRYPVIEYNNERDLNNDLWRTKDALVSLADVAGLSSLGSALAVLRRFGESLQAFNSALDLWPQNPVLLHNRGIVLAEMEQYSRAIENFDAALAQRPGDASTQIVKGSALARLERFAEALACFDAARESRPDDPGLLLRRGRALMCVEQFMEAIEDFDAALELQPENPDTLCSKGFALIKIGQCIQALKTFDAALSLQPDDPDALLGRANALAQVGQLEEALKCYDRVLMMRSDDPVLLRNKGITLTQLRRNEDARESFDAALRLRPDDSSTLTVMGVALVDMARFEDALEYLDAALALRSDDPVILAFRGIALANLERYLDAIQSYDAALALRPDDPMVLRNRGSALAKLARFDEALDSYTAGLKVQPDDPLTLLNLGLALVGLELYDNAIKTFDKALVLDPDNEDIVRARELTLELQWSVEQREA